jgi:hypothetical protein
MVTADIIIAQMNAINKVDEQREDEGVRAEGEKRGEEGHKVTRIVPPVTQKRRYRRKMPSRHPTRKPSRATAQSWLLKMTKNCWQRQKVAISMIPI